MKTKTAAPDWTWRRLGKVSRASGKGGRQGDGLSGQRLHGPKSGRGRAHGRLLSSLGRLRGKRSTHLASQKVEGWVAETRKAAAAFIGADSPNEIVFTSGTTEAADIVARPFPTRTAAGK